MAPTVCMLGLPWDDPTLPPHVDHQELKKGLEQTVKDIRAAGYDFDFLPATAAEGKEVYTVALKKKKYDAVIIGFGVRGLPQNTEYFETLINTIAAVSPGSKFGFNASPETTLDAVKRALPM